jgi:hypothetical protein
MCVCIDSPSLGKLSLPLQPLRGLATVREHSHHQLPLCVSLGYNIGLDVTLKVCSNFSLYVHLRDPLARAHVHRSVVM